MAKQLKYMPGFEAVSGEIFLLRAEPGLAATAASSTDAATTVIMFGWGNALPKHLVKYADGYRALFPGARVILVRSPIATILFGTVPARSPAMRPVIQAAFDPAFGSLGPEKERILVQISSNIGMVSFMACQLEYNRLIESGGAKLSYKLPDAKPFPYQLLVCDSNPSSRHFQTNVNRWSSAMADATAPSLPWPYFFTKLIWTCFLWANHAYTRMLGRQTVPEASGDVFFDPKYSTTAAPKLFLYSKGDPIIVWQDVEASIAEAKQRGYRCSAELFDESLHVGHMKLYPERYWAAIAKAWEERHS